MSIEYYGAKVTPDSLREILYGVKELTPILNTFRLMSYEDKNHNKRMEIAAELVKDAPAPTDTNALADRVFNRLGEMNGDFYNAMFRTATPDNLPKLSIHALRDRAVPRRSAQAEERIRHIEPAIR